MESKIEKIIHKSFPEIFSGSLETKPEFSEYSLLQKLAAYVLKLMHEKKSEKLRDLFETVDKMYHYGTRHERNAIENEFLSHLAQEVKEDSLKDHLRLMPKELKEAYIKNILEN